MKPAGRFADLRRLTGDAGLVTLGQLVSYAYPLVSIPLLSRVLGIDGLGVFIVILATVQILLVLTDFGFGFSALRRISVTTCAQERQRVVASTITAKLALWAAGAVVLLAAVAIVPSMRGSFLLYLIGVLLTVGAVFYPMWYLQGVRRLKLFALLTAGSRLVALVGLILTVRSADDVALAVVWQFLPFLLSAVVFWIVMIAEGELRLRLSNRAEAGVALTDSVPLFINLISGQVIVNSSAILLGQLAGYRQVGLFGPADRLTSAIHGVLVAVEQAMMPRVAAAHAEPDLPNRRRAIMIGLISCYALSGGVLALTAPWLIPWYLGDGFAEAVPTVQVMGLATALSGVTRTFILDLVSAGRSRICSIVSMSGAAWHLVTATIGAWGWGAVGVAVAVCGTQFFMGTCVMIADLRGPRRPDRLSEAHPSPDPDRELTKEEHR